ncbi:unnamed protein product [Larinioides sclopetarius]
MNQDLNVSTPEISLPSNSSATNYHCNNSFIFPNEISSNPSVNEGKAFTKRKIIHSEGLLSNQKNPPNHGSFHFHEIKTEPLSPCKTSPIEISSNHTNNTTTEVSESSITTIILKEEKELVPSEFLVKSWTPQKNLENNIIINNSFSLSENSSVFLTNKENAWISSNDSVTYLGDTLPGQVDMSTNCSDFVHQKESLSAENNIPLVKKTLEAEYKGIVDTVSYVQMQQTEAQNTCAGKMLSSMSGDSTEAIIDESENTDNETGWNPKKKQKRFKRKRISINTQTSKFQQRQISPQCSILIKEPYKENRLNSKNLNIKQFCSKGDISTEAIVTESELSENEIRAKPRRKRKRFLKKITSHEALFNHAQINTSVEKLLKSKIGASENGSFSETSATASFQSEYVTNSADKKRKFKMKNNLMDSTNIKPVGSPKLSHVEESDSSIQKPPKKRVKILFSDTSDDIPFPIQERTSQSEIINEISPEHDTSIEVNVNQYSDPKSDRNFLPKRKLRSHKNVGVNFKDSDTESSKNVIPERKLRSHKERRPNVKKGSDTKNYKSIVPKRKERSHMVRGENVNQDSNTESNRSIVPRRKLRSHIKGDMNFNLDSNTKIDVDIIPKRKLRSHKKADTSLCVSNCIRSQSKENSSSSEETGTSIRNSLREKIQFIECNSSNAKTNRTPKRIVQKKLNYLRECSENDDILIKKYSENLKEEVVSKKSIVSHKRTRIPTPLNHENLTKDHTISKENTDAILQTIDYEKEQLSKNSLENKLGVMKVPANENKLVEDFIYSELKSTVIPTVNEEENVKEKSFSKVYKNTHQKLAMNENQFSKRNDLTEVEEHMALKPMQVPSLCNNQILEIFSNKQESSTKITFMPIKKTPDLKQIFAKCSTSEEEIKRLDSENLNNENTREFLGKYPENLQYDNIKPTSSIYTKEVSQQDGIYEEEADLKEVPPLINCSVVLKKIILPLEAENRETMNDNHMDILPSGDAFNSLEQKIKFSVSSALVTNREAEHGIETEQHITSTLKDSLNSTKENNEDDLNFDTDDTPDINSDIISPESVYDDSDSDPDWFMDDDSFQKPSEFSVKKNQKEISSHEDSDSDDAPLRERNTHRSAKKSGHLSSKESTKDEVKFCASRKKKLINRATNKEKSSLENIINSAIKEDLINKKETRNKWKKLFWSTDADSDSGSELILVEGKDKHLAENVDFNNSEKTITTENQICDLKMKDAFSLVSSGSIEEGKKLKNQESDHSFKITGNGVARNRKNNAKKKTKIESIDSDFDFDAELIANEINCEALVLPKNLIVDKKILLVEDKIFGSDSSSNNEENTTAKECKNCNEDNMACNDKVMLKNNNSSDDINSDFDAELIDEIICEELELPEHLIINDLQKNKQTEDRILRSDDGIKNLQQYKDVTIKKDDPIYYDKTLDKQKKKYNDKSDSVVSPELTISENHCEGLQLPENWIKNDPQKILSIEDKVFRSPCDLTNISSERSKKISEKSSSCHYKTVCEINKFYSDNSDFDINSELIGSGQNCDKLQLPENNYEKFIPIEDKILESVCNLENTITEKCEKVISEEGKSTSNEKIACNNNCISNSNSNIDVEWIRKKPNYKELNLPQNDYQNNMTITDRILQFKKENEKLSSKENDTFCKTGLDVLQTQQSCSSFKSIENAASELCTNIPVTSIAEKSTISHGKTICKINKFYNDSDINSELIRSGQNCEGIQMPKNDCQEFIPVEDKISVSICSLENIITKKCEKVIIEEGNSTDNEKIVHEIDKDCISNSNSDVHANLIRKEPNCERLNLSESDHQRNMSLIDRMLKSAQENELSSKMNDVFCKTKSNLLQTQISCNRMKSIGNDASETCENISVGEKHAIFHDEAVHKVNFQNDSSDSDINSKLIRNRQNGEELQLPESDCEELIPVENKISESLCNLENTVTKQYEKVNKEVGNSTSNEKIICKINKNYINSSNSPIDAESIRKEPNCEELNLPENDHQKNIPATNKILQYTKEHEMLSSKENETFCKKESDLLQTQPSCISMKSIEKATSETSENISVMSEKEELRVKTAGKGEENYNVSDIVISDKMGLIIDEADNNVSMHDSLESDLIIVLPVDEEAHNVKKENTSKEDVLISEKELKICKEQKSGGCVQSMENIILEKINTFMEHKKEVSTHIDMTIKNMGDFNLGVDNYSDYAAELVSDPVQAKNCENLNEEDSKTCDSSQIQVCEIENSQIEFLQDNLSNLNKSSLKLLQNDAIPNFSTKLNPINSSSLSKIKRDTLQMLKANENQFCTKAAFPISHPKCVPVETSNISKIKTQTDIEAKRTSYQMPTSRKPCDISANEKSATVFDNLHLKGNLPFSLLKASKTRITKNAGRLSKDFYRHRDTQKYFKHKKPEKRKTCNEYLKYKNVKINPENPIKSILQGIDVNENFYTQLKPHTSLFVASVRFDHCVKSLINYLMHPHKTPDLTYLIFLIIKYLHHIRQNPLENFSQNQENVFLPATENCIVTALFEIDKKSKPGFQKLLETLLNVMYQFILAKNKIHIYGLASLCRVFTEICKHKKDKLKPLQLCCDLLKEKHKFASILIVSVAKVWRELFWISDNSLEKENALQMSIAYGITKSVKSSVIVSMYCSLEVVSEYFDISRNVSDVNKFIEVLKNEILEKSTRNSLKNTWKLTEPILIFTSFETWESTKKHLIDDFIIPNLQWFSHQVANKEAFDLFSNLYVDILLLYPEHNPDELLMKFFHASSTCKGDSFIQDCAAVALIKHFILSKRNIPLFLTTWQEKNQTKPKVKALKILFQRRLMSDTPTTFSKDEIII